MTVGFTAKPGKLAALFDLLAILVSKTKREQGCFEYGYYRSVDNPTVFTTFQEWDDPKSEAAHGEMPHLKNPLGQLPELIEGEAVVPKYEKVI